MSRLVSNLVESGIAQIKLSSNLLGTSHYPRPTVHLTQTVRWYRPRKPFWLPKAKSKMFRIPVKPQIPEEEYNEIVRLYNVYRTQMKSVQAYFKEYLMSQTTAPEVIAERKQKETEQHALSIKENDLWNAEVAKLREKRLAKEAIEKEKKILDKIITHETEQRELIEKIDQHIRMEKEAAKSFITADNIDEAIENALNNVVDHNYCIDLEGNIYKGRYAKPPPSLTDKKTTVPPPSAQQEQVKAEVRS